MVVSGFEISTTTGLDILTSFYLRYKLNLTLHILGVDIQTFVLRKATVLEILLVETKMEEPEHIDSFIIHTTVDYISEKFHEKHISGFGKDAKFKSVSDGWFIRLTGTNESFFISETEPDWKAGDKVKITLEKV